MTHGKLTKEYSKRQMSENRNLAVILSSLLARMQKMQKDGRTQVSLRGNEARGRVRER